MYYLQNRKAKTVEQVIDLLVLETLSPACLRHVLSTEGTGWFGPEKLTEVIDIYENSQTYLPGKYSKFSGTGSAKPGGCLFHSQNVGNSQNSAAYPRWKTGRSGQANGTPCRCWLCGEIGHKAVHCNKRGATQVSLSQEKRGASGNPAAGVNNAKAEPVQCNRVAIEARNQPGTNLIGARPAQDISDFKFPDSSVYEAADRICEAISRKQAICSNETLLKGVVSASHDHNAGHIATDEPEIRLVNRIDFSMKKGVSFSSEDAFLDKMDLANCKQPSQLSEYCNIAMF